MFSEYNILIFSLQIGQKEKVKFMWYDWCDIVTS